MLGDIRLFASICKIDEEKRQVFGYASTEKRDQQGEIVRKDAIAKALPEYMQWGAVREMHQPSAVGSAIEANPDDKGLWFGAQVVDDRAWKKCVSKPPVYKGFSVGGRVTSRDPTDPSIITGLELTEISLVDRPANPEAKFEIVKRASDGTLHYQPSQIWTCGIAEHQHISKVEACTCLENQFVKANNSHLDTGHFTNHSGLAGEAKQKATDHADVATRASIGAARHRRLAEEARGSKDMDALVMHENLAQRGEALAEHHRQAAEQYNELASHHDNLVPNKEIDMSTKTVADVTKEAAAIVAQLGSIVTEPVVKAVDNLAAVQEAHTAGVEHDGKAEEAINEAQESRAKATSERANGNTDSAKESEEEAKTSENTAELHHNLATENHNLALHHLKQAGATGDITAAASANIAHNQTHAAKASGWAAEQDGHEAVAKAQGREEDGHHSHELAKSLRDVSDHRKGMAKAYGVMAAGNSVSENKCTKASKLTKVNGAYLDKKGNWFGKREFSDDKRQELANKGYAMPDGSYPINNKDDLSNAIQAFGRAKDQEAVKSLIIRRATDLGAVDLLPTDWDKENTAKGVIEDQKDMAKPSNATTPGVITSNSSDLEHAAGSGGPEGSGDIRAEAGASQSETTETTLTIPGVAKANRKCMKCGKSVGIEDKTCSGCGEDLEKAKEEEAEKGMGIVTRLAYLLADVEQVHKSSLVEQMMKAANDGSPDKIEEWLSQGVALLEKVVANETATVLEGVNKEAATTVAYKTTAQEVQQINLLTCLSKAVLDSALNKSLPVSDRATRKDLASSLSKLGTTLVTVSDNSDLARKVDQMTIQYNEVVKERDQAIASLDNFTKQITPMVRATQDMKKSLGESQTLIADLNNRLKRVEAQPLPSRAVGVHAITKSMDIPVETSGNASISENKDPILQKVLEVPPGQERADAIVKMAHKMREK